jgi:murein DD-endopeptidase MepM/ murein hydrolase activator NlpD
VSPESLRAIAPEFARPAAPSGIEEQRRLRGKPPLAVAREFEAILFAQIIGAMRQTIPSSGLLQAAAAHRVLDGAFDQEVARSLVARADFGIARQLAAQLERHDAAHHEPSSVPASAAGLAAVPLRAGGAGIASAAPPVSDEQTEAAVVPPVAGRVTSRFGVRRDPIKGTPQFHAGVDLAARRGARVRAVAPGEVIFAGRRGGAGNVVEVQHPDSLVTSYAHVARTLVHAGQKVAAGDVLATVGSSGRTTGPHLHFAVRRDGQPIDPVGILGRAPAHASPQIGHGRTPSEV